MNILLNVNCKQNSCSGNKYFHLAYLLYILRIYKMSSNDEKWTLPKLKKQQDRKEEFPFLVFTSTSKTCKLCIKFDSKIMGCKNYYPSFVNSSTNFRKSTVKDHTNTMMHSEAVKLDKIEKIKEVGEKYVTKLTPIGRNKIGESFKKSGSIAYRIFFKRIFWKTVSCCLFSSKMKLFF